MDLCLADLITGFGVARAAARLVAGEDARRPDCLDGLRVVVEGFGNVGGPAALYLARMGARIVAVRDADSALLPREAMSAPQVEEVLRRRRVREIPDHPDRHTGEAVEQTYHADADLFVPAAVSGSLGPDRLAGLASGGVRWMVCGANQPIRESRLGDTTNSRAADQRFGIVGDVVGSMGMARAFHHLMADGPAEGAEEVFDAVRVTMEDSVAAVVERNGGAGPGLLAHALGFALDRIGFD